VIGREMWGTEKGNKHIFLGNIVLIDQPQPVCRQGDFNVNKVLGYFLGWKSSDHPSSAFQLARYNYKFQKILKSLNFGS
jgi:hypothetical protein